MNHPLPFADQEKARYWKERTDRDRASAERRAIEKERLSKYFSEYRDAATRLFAVIQQAARDNGGLKTTESWRRIIETAESFRSSDAFFAGLDEPEGFWHFFDVIVDRLNLCYLEVAPGDNRTIHQPRTLMLSERAVARVWEALARDLAKLEELDVDDLIARMRSSIRHAVVQYGYWETLPFETREFASIAGVRQRIHSYQIHTGFSPPEMDDARANSGALVSSSLKGGANGAFRRSSSRRDLSFSYLGRLAARGLYRRASQGPTSRCGSCVPDDWLVRRSAACAG